MAGFFGKLLKGELGVAVGQGGGGGEFRGDESVECAMLRKKVLGGTVLESRELLLVYDAAKDGWNAGGAPQCTNKTP